jgi:hypothetical protein
MLIGQLEGATQPEWVAAAMAFYSQKISINYNKTIS